MSLFTSKLFQVAALGLTSTDVGMLPQVQQVFGSKITLVAEAILESGKELKQRSEGDGPQPAKTVTSNPDITGEPVATDYTKYRRGLFCIFLVLAVLTAIGLILKPSFLFKHGSESEGDRAIACWAIACFIFSTLLVLGFGIIPGIDAKFGTILSISSVISLIFFFLMVINVLRSKFNSEGTGSDRSARIFGLAPLIGFLVIAVPLLFSATIPEKMTLINGAKSGLILPSYLFASSVLLGLSLFLFSLSTAEIDESSIGEIHEVLFYIFVGVVSAVMCAALLLNIYIGFKYLEIVAVPEAHISGGTSARQRLMFFAVCLIIFCVLSIHSDWFATLPMTLRELLLRLGLSFAVALFFLKFTPETYFSSERVSGNFSKTALILAFFSIIFITATAPFCIKHDQPLFFKHDQLTRGVEIGFSISILIIIFFTEIWIIYRGSDTHPMIQIGIFVITFILFAWALPLEASYPHLGLPRISL